MTYFWVQLGPKKLPVYQQATIMFKFGLKDGGDLVIGKGGAAPNSSVLGAKGSVFLAKFCAALSANYESEINDNKLDPDQWHQDKYIDALINALKAFTYDDATKYGKIGEMKPALMELSDDGQLPPEALALIHFRNIMITRNLNSKDPTIVDFVLTKLPDTAEIDRLMKNRESQ